MASPYLAKPKQAPSLDFPASPHTVDVRVIDSTTLVTIPPSILVEPYIEGHDDMACPAYSFLVTNGARHVLFDLGSRKDIASFPPAVLNRVKNWVYAEKDVAEILSEDAAGLGIKPRDIEAVILSHHHWDHTGNMTTFPKSTAVVVGPGFKKALEPFYPTNPDSPMLEADVEGRQFREIDIAGEGKGLKIGPFGAYDYFEDGSFYLLDTPGHAPGHIAGLARVTESPATFMLLSGDACHHGGEIRPTEYLPLPSDITPSPTPKFSTCPGALIQKMHPQGSATTPFYNVKEGFPYDPEVCERTLDYIKEFDANDSVLLAMAHDRSLEHVIDFYPAVANNWKAKKANEAARWKFLMDFRKAVENVAA